jgi:type I restriction enzyme S subunit
MKTAAIKKSKRYESYKDSGVEWLGEIPEHWEVKRFKFLAQSNKGKLPSHIVSENIDDLPP